MLSCLRTGWKGKRSLSKAMSERHHFRPESRERTRILAVRCRRSSVVPKRTFFVDAGDESSKRGWAAWFWYIGETFCLRVSDNGRMTGRAKTHKAWRDTVILSECALNDGEDRVQPRYAHCIHFHSRPELRLCAVE